MRRLDGKIVIVTGASRGIGAAAAERLAEAGASLLLLARSAADLAAVAGRLGAARVDVMACDVADYGQVQAAADRARQLFGRIDAIVNNAGVIAPIGPLATSDPAAWTAATAVNFTGVYNGMRAVLPTMRAQGAGVIVNLGSGAAHTPLEGWSHYCAAKAATHMLTRCAHLENRGRGVRVVSLSPGTVATDMQRQIKASGINPVSQMDASAHASPDAPARAIVWLLTDDAAPYAGEEVSLRDPEIRRRAGLDG